MIYEWDPAKAATNLRKHRVTFDEATSVFRDALALTFDDPDHSLDASRFITVGESARQRLLLVTHADRRVDRSESSVHGALRQEKPMPTKNRAVSKPSDMRAEYDLSKLTGRVQGKHYAQATAGVALVLLESDIAEAFSTGRAVNKALRSVLLAKRKATLANKALQPTSRAEKSEAAPRRVRTARG